MTHTSTEHQRENCTACNATGSGSDGWDCLRCDGDGWVFVYPKHGAEPTKTSTEQPELPEALRLAEMLTSGSAMIPEIDLPEAAAELRRLHARVQELEASQAQRVPLSEHKQALDLLAGLHPGITIDGPPMAVAELIFDAVQADQRALKDEIAKQERNLDWMRKELAKRATKAKDCQRPECIARGCFGCCMKGITQEKQG